LIIAVFLIAKFYQIIMIKFMAITIAEMIVVTKLAVIMLIIIVAIIIAIVILLFLFQRHPD